MNPHIVKTHLLQAQLVVIIMLLGGIGIAALMLVARGGNALPASQAWAAPEWVRQNNEEPPHHTGLQDSGDAYLQIDAVEYAVLPGDNRSLTIEFFPSQFDPNIISDITFTLDYDPNDNGWLLFTPQADSDGNGLPDNIKVGTKVNAKPTATRSYSPTSEAGEFLIHLTYSDTVKDFEDDISTRIAVIELEATTSVEDMPPKIAEAGVLLKNVEFSNGTEPIPNDNGEGSDYNEYKIPIQSSLDLIVDPSSIKIGQTTNLTAQFTARDYARLKWDFDGDGTWDKSTPKADVEIKEDGENVGAGLETNPYYTAGTYAPRVILCYDNTDGSCILQGETSGLTVVPPNLSLESAGATYLGTPTQLTAILDPDFTDIAEEIKWDFGDGSPPEYLPYEEPKNTVQEHTYGKATTEPYPVIVTVYLPDEYTPNSVEKSLDVRVLPPDLGVTTNRDFYYRSQPTTFTVSVENLHIDGSTIQIDYGDGKSSDPITLSKDDGADQSLEYVHTYSTVNTEGYPVVVTLTIPAEFGGLEVTANKTIPIRQPASDVTWLNENPLWVIRGNSSQIRLKANGMVDGEEVPMDNEEVVFSKEKGANLGNIINLTNGGRTDANGVITATLETVEQFGTIELHAKVAGTQSEVLNVQLVASIYAPLILNTNPISDTTPISNTTGF